MIHQKNRLYVFSVVILILLTLSSYAFFRDTIEEVVSYHDAETPYEKSNLPDDGCTMVSSGESPNRLEPTHHYIFETSNSKYVDLKGSLGLMPSASNVYHINFGLSENHGGGFLFYGPSSLDEDEQSHYLLINDEGGQLNADSHLTYAAWVLFPEDANEGCDPSNDKYMIMSHGAPTNDLQMGFWLNCNLNVHAQVSLSGGRLDVTTTTSIEPDKWTHIAVLKSSGKLEIYVNGVFVGSDTSDYSMIKKSSDDVFLEIGSSPGASHVWPGLIDDVRVYVDKEGISRKDIIEMMAWFEDEKYCCQNHPDGNFIAAKNGELGYCIDGEFVTDTSSGLNICRLRFEHVHGSGSFQANPARVDDSDLISPWAIDSTSRGCCGVTELSIGTIMNLDETLHICTSTSGGTFGWAHLDVPGRVYNVTSKSSFGDDFNDDYSYLIATSESGIFVCNETYSTGNMHNTVCSRTNVHCNAIGGVKNFENDDRGFFCANNTKVVVNEDFDDFDIEVDETRPSLAIAICGDYDSSYHGQNNKNTIILEVGDYISHDVDTIYYCTDSGTFVTDLGSHVFNTVFNENTDACDNVNLRSAVGIHYYAPLDRFWRTGSNCCGDSLNNPEYFQDTLLSDSISRACWNNRAVDDDSTINKVVGTVEPFNLLRVNPSNPFVVEDGI